jgi:hypothetical protein
MLLFGAGGLIDLIVCILKKKLLSLIEVHDALFATHQF